MLNDLKIMVSKRWQEMLLIIGFLAIGMFLFELLNAEATAMQQAAVNGPIANGAAGMSQTTTLLYSLAMMAFMVLWLILFLGFLGTLSINYATPLDPMVLVRIGKRFFWRFVRFQFLFALYYLAASILIFSAVKFLLFPSIEPENVSPWVSYACGVIVMGVLAKPILLIPPIMICRNCMVFQAVRTMSRCRISDMKILPIVFVTGLIITGALSAVHMEMAADTTLFKVIIAVKAILAGIFYLATGAIGVWFISGSRFGVLEELQEQENADQESVE
jgi:hypothetical protein